MVTMMLRIFNNLFYVLRFRKWKKNNDESVIWLQTKEWEKKNVIKTLSHFHIFTFKPRTLGTKQAMNHVHNTLLLILLWWWTLPVNLITYKTILRWIEWSFASSEIDSKSSWTLHIEHYIRFGIWHLMFVLFVLNHSFIHCSLHNRKAFNSCGPIWILCQKLMTFPMFKA